MPNYTDNYELILPEEEEYYDIGVHNTNMETLDGVLDAVAVDLATAEGDIGIIQTDVTTL